MAAPKKSATKDETGTKQGGTSAKKSTGETTAKKSGASAKKSAGAGKGGAAGQGGAKTQGGLARAVTPDKDLAKVVGGEPLTRAELTKKIWEYIRSNNLQDQGDRRMINADKNLKTIFGGKDQVSMFEMTKLVNQHVS